VDTEVLVNSMDISNKNLRPSSAPIVEGGLYTNCYLSNFIVRILKPTTICTLDGHFHGYLARRESDQAIIALTTSYVQRNFAYIAEQDKVVTVDDDLTVNEINI